MQRFPVTYWYSGLGVGDGQDYGTRGYLRSLMEVGYEHILIPPADKLHLYEKEFEEFYPFFEYPPKYQFHKKLIEEGDPRVGQRWEHMKNEWYSESGPCGPISEPTKFDNIIRAGDVDHHYYKDHPMTNQWEPRCEAVVMHFDPGKLARTRGVLVQSSGGEVPMVGVTAWESDRIPTATIQQLSDLDMLIVVSPHTAKAFENSGLDQEVLVRVVPHALDMRPLDHEPAPKPAHDRYVFYAIGTNIPRKNLKAVIAAYSRAFEAQQHKGVGLVIKTQGNNDNAKKLREDGFELAGTKTSPKIVIYTDTWSHARVRSLHMGCDCFVSATRAEGFGLNELDAASLGNPVITTDWGAAPWVLKGLVDDYNYLVPGTICKVDPEMAKYGVYDERQQWCDPDVDALADAMKRAFDARQPKSLERAALTAERYSNERVGGLLASALGEVKELF